MDSTKINLSDLDSYMVYLIDSGYKLYETRYKTKIASKFGLEVISAEGTTRIVFREPRSSTVIKVGYPAHNRAEYSLYKALECSVLGDLLAPCRELSPLGYALVMDYIPFEIPSSRGTEYWFSGEFVELREELESNFDFIKGYSTYSWGADFHEENMRVTAGGDVKIVDYSNILVDMFEQRKSTTVNSAIRGVLKLNYPTESPTIRMDSGRLHYYKGNTHLTSPVFREAS